MTPAQGWRDRDYFLARDRARAAWQATDQQLCLSEALGRQPGLEAAGNPEGLAEPHDGLAAGENERLGESVTGGLVDVRRVASTPGRSPAASPSWLTPGAEPHRDPPTGRSRITVPSASLSSRADGSAPTSPAEETGDAPPPATEARKTPLSESPASAGTTPANNGGSAASSPQKPRGAPAEGV